jgi:hypothetical protein
MYRNFFSLIKLFPLILVLITSCVLDIENPTKESLSIEWITIDYDQVENKLFLQLEILPVNEAIDSVIVKVSSENYDSTFILNDNGVSGDIIAENNRYSVTIEVDLPFEDYQFDAIVYTPSSNLDTKSAKITIEKQYPPEILDVIFIKSYEDGSGYEFDSNSPYFVNDEDTSYLNFQITIKDLNGIENIQSIRYKTETLWLSAVGECGCEEEETCNYSSPTFYLNNINLTSNDSIFTFEAINDYIKAPGFPINPISVCNRLGMITFSFVVFDAYFGAQTFVEELLFLPCSEGDWNCEYDCEYCTSVCGECSE